MKFVGPISVGLATLALASCGGSGAGPATAPPTSTAAKTTASHTKLKLAMSKAERERLPKLEIRRRSGPPPKRLVVHDLRQGSGAAIRPNDTIFVKFFSVEYGEALKKSRAGRSAATRFTMSEVINGWKVGLPGMKVGGRRELIVPPSLGYEGFTPIYVIDLLAIDPGGSP